MKNKNKIGTISLIFTLSSLFLIVFFVYPLIADIKKSSENIISSKNEMQTLRAQIVETEKFRKNYVNYKSNLGKIDQLFVDLNNPVDFIKFLETTAEKSQIILQVALPTSSQTTKQGSPDSLNFQISIKGGFLGVLDFIKKIEEGTYLIEVENLTMGNSNTESSGSLVGGKKVLVENIYKNYPNRGVEAKISIKVFVKK